MDLLILRSLCSTEACLHSDVVVKFLAKQRLMNSCECSRLFNNATKQLFCLSTLQWEDLIYRCLSGSFFNFIFLFDRQVTLFEEFMLLKEFEKRENIFANKVNTKLTEKEEMQEKVRQTTSQLLYGWLRERAR